MDHGEKRGMRIAPCPVRSLESRQIFLDPIEDAEAVGGQASDEHGNGRRPKILDAGRADPQPDAANPMLYPRFGPQVVDDRAEARPEGVSDVDEAQMRLMGCLRLCGRHRA